MLGFAGGVNEATYIKHSVAQWVGQLLLFKIKNLGFLIIKLIFWFWKV